MTEAKEVTLKDVCEFLMAQARTREDYFVVANAFKLGQKMSVQNDKHQFRPGMQVKWTGKDGLTREGRVIKLGKSLIHVQVAKGSHPLDVPALWRVSPGLLTRV